MKITKRLYVFLAFMIIALGAVSFSGENESFNFNQINKNIRMMLKTFELDQSLLGEATDPS